MATASPLAEARGLYRLVTAGKTTFEALRREIGVSSPYRKAVLLHFDALADPKQFKNNVRLEVEKRLRAGLSYARIAAELPVRFSAVAQLGKAIGASMLKKRGRGRRFSPELREQIRTAVKSGKRSAEIQREFKIDYDTVLQFRHEIGDFENRRYWRYRLPAAEIAKGTDMLKSGMGWRVVAAQLGCCLATLQNNVQYRKDRHLSPEQLAQARDKLRQGQSWESVGAELGFSRATLQRQIAWRKLGAKKKRCRTDGNVSANDLQNSERVQERKGHHEEKAAKAFFTTGS